MNRLIDPVTHDNFLLNIYLKHETIDLSIGKSFYMDFREFAKWATFLYIINLDPLFSK